LLEYYPENEQLRSFQVEKKRAEYKAMSETYFTNEADYDITSNLDAHKESGINKSDTERKSLKQIKIDVLRTI
jgi:hypothetical protein